MLKMFLNFFFRNFVPENLQNYKQKQVNRKSIVILGIESSCDETSAAVLRDGKIISNVIATQKIHEKYGGVVPELASRAHQKNIIPVVNEALKIAGIENENISAIAFTKGPGLLGSLLVGVSFAKGLALGLEIPLIEVNHLDAHVLSVFIDNNPKFPFLCMIVSGGHTQIVLAKNFDELQIIGQTLDDAAGEAFDKTAKIFGLPYPGGPLIDKNAQNGNATAFQFPHPKISQFDFSFSGLKTSVLYFIREKLKADEYFIEKNMNDLCASVQKTIVEILMEKLISASKKFGINEIAIAGGVAANSGLRKTLAETAEKLNWKIYIPKFEYCTDNAAMIAMAGYYKFLKGDFTSQSATAFASTNL